MGDFFAELKRRHIYQVAAAYAVVAWILLQLVNNVAPGLNLPNWAVTLVIVLLAVGFPIALLFAWIHQLAPSDGAAASARTGRLDWALMGALMVVIAIVAYQQFAPAPGARSAQASVAAPAGSPAPGGAVSVAVLPFVNLSSDKEQEFFSDGMTEEITSALARISGLTVIGRTSAFEFKGQNKDLRAIGQALSATHLIEGSVRKAGDRVRITAQLIRADTGAHLWTENYDRELKDVFAVQEDIAQAIAASLQVPLGLKQGETLVSNRTSDLKSYDGYLRARELFRGRQLDQTIAVLEPLVAHDPDFAPAWALLARAYALAPFFSSELRQGSLDEARRVVQTAFASAEKAVREAIRLDPRNAAAYGALGYIQARSGEWAMSDDTSRQALAFDPNDPELLDAYSQSLAAEGRIKDARMLRELLLKLDPLVPLFGTTTGEVMQSVGEARASIPILEAISPTPSAIFNRNVYLARAYAATGRFADASAVLLKISDTKQVSRQSVEDAARLLRSAPAKTAAPQTLPVLQGELNFAYVYAGAPDRVLEFAERSVALQKWMNGTWIRSLWLPEFAPVRKTERFKALMRKAGLVDYWKARGWPDLCHPLGAEDFACN